MEPQDTSSHQQNIRSKPDPTAWSKSLAIALVVSAAFLVAAAGIVVWMVFGNKHATSPAVNTPADDAVNVKNVSWVVSADFPLAVYAKNDQSDHNGTYTMYYDDGSNCGVTLGVTSVTADKSIQDIVTGQLAAHAVQGVATTAKVATDDVKLKESTGDKTYTFAAVNVDQTVDVPGVAYTKQHNVILYKQFGNQVASLGYACKDETWAEKKPELARWIQTFTVKTER